MIKSLSRFVTYLLVSCNLSIAHADELYVGWELWYPYQYHNKQGDLVGLDIAIFNALAKELNVSVKYTEIPWKRHLQLIKQGQIDVAFGASYTQERDKYAFFTTPYRTETVNLFVRKGQAETIKLQTLSDLIGSSYMIGVEGGYFYGENYQQLIKNSKFRANISEVIDLEENVNLLLKGHIDGFLVDPITMSAFAKKYQMTDEFEKHDLKIYQDDIYIMLSRKTSNEKVLKSFNEAISKLKANGKLEQIINTWRKQVH